MTLRESLDAIRAGPALLAGLPGDEVDVERLVTHLVAHGFSGGVHLADRDTESLLWVHDGAPRDVWFFESGGSEAALTGALGHDLFNQMAARGGTLSVLVGAPPHPAAGEVAAGEAVDAQAAAAETAEPVVHADLTAAAVETVVAAAPAVPIPQAPAPDPPPVPHAIQFPHPVPTPEPVAAPGPARTAPMPVLESEPPKPVFETAPSASPVAAASPRVEPSIPEPPSHPWAAILEDVAERVERHRGPKLAARFAAALDAALAAHGGRLEGGRIVAPELSESTWRIVVEAACAPITAVAGRAFVDRTIAAADREVRLLQAGASGFR